MIRLLKRTLSTIVAIAIPTVALASLGIGDVGSSGHPLIGWGVMLSILLAGFFAIQFGRRSILLLPVTAFTILATAGVFLFDADAMRLTAIIPAAAGHDIAIAVAAGWALTGYFPLVQKQLHWMVDHEDMGRLTYSLGMFAALWLLQMAGLIFAWAMATEDDDRQRASEKSRDTFTAFAGLGVGAGIL